MYLNLSNVYNVYIAQILIRFRVEIFCLFKSVLYIVSESESWIKAFGIESTPKSISVTIPIYNK